MGLLACSVLLGLLGWAGAAQPLVLPAPLPRPAADRMRLTALGTGVPRVMRSQAATSYLLQLGNGQSFLFDIGDGALTNAIQVAPGTFGNAKLFLTHLHSDHIADAVQLLALGPMLGGRAAGPLHVYGPSGPTPGTGTAAFVDGLNRMLAWDRLSRERVKRPAPQQPGQACAAGQACDGDEAPSEGGAGDSAGGNIAVAHEFDYDGGDRQLVYDYGGVKVYSTPADHYYTGGPVAYRLEWRGLSAVFGGDGAATPSLEALCAGADVAVIDAMATSLDDDRVPTMRGGGERGASGGGGGSRGGGGGGGGGGGAAQRAMSEVERRNIAMSHATPFEAGEMLAAAAPRLAIATHNAINGFSMTYIASEIRKAYGGALSIAQDLDFWDIGPSTIEAGHLMVPDQTWGLLFASNSLLEGGEDAAGGGGGIEQV